MNHAVINYFLEFFILLAIAFCLFALIYFVFVAFSFRFRRFHIYQTLFGKKVSIKLNLFRDKDVET